ncbi:hypothetical protein ELH40_35550 (plasmid) [Rhizobium ruizarguesonis]|uniref:Transposase n=1 Tax=Rhizobium ruizarguesonis TaxID=2081791 RepID=A0AB38HRQ9_9HYPH|nr:hypothetical protein ELH40_35550 [Rhizobium ruizarguesonis]
MEKRKPKRSLNPAVVTLAAEHIEISAESSCLPTNFIHYGAERRGELSLKARADPGLKPSTY